MANIEHVNITDPNIHEPKGVAAASVGQVYVADGSGSGDWSTYNWHGWADYADGATGNQVFNQTAAKIQIDSGTVVGTYLPLAIRGTGNLWNGTSDKITPIVLGDAYMVRLTLPFTAESGAPTLLTLKVDISGTTAPSNVVNEIDIPFTKTPSFNHDVSFPIYITQTFMTNGGQLFLTCDAGTVTVNSPSIFITRLSAGNL